MGRDDVRKALQAMDDEDVRARLAEGDFSDVSGFAFTDDERAMVRDAAAEYPEVAGFAYDAFVKIDFTTAGPGSNSPFTAEQGKFKISQPFFDAMQYAGGA